MGDSLPLGRPVQDADSEGREHGRLLTASWMSDSRHLLLSVDHLFVADSRSGELRQITASTSLEVAPAASPDGHRIAFSSGTVDSDLVQITLDGSCRNRSSRPPAASRTPFSRRSDRNTRM